MTDTAPIHRRAITMRDSSWLLRRDHDEAQYADVPRVLDELAERGYDVGSFPRDTRWRQHAARMVRGPRRMRARERLSWAHAIAAPGGWGSGEALFPQPNRTSWLMVRFKAADVEEGNVLGRR
jgi:Sugar-binding cellulase-like